ncbi:hypothetical protein DIPPA_17033 [Diplonema papillatum]|nr:hypothetical protein DIPPA_17033 [Diplonema papillatum]
MMRTLSPLLLVAAVAGTPSPAPFVILPSKNEFPAAKRDDMVDRINTLRGNLGLCPISWDETIVQDVKDNYLLNETYDRCDEYQLEVEAGTNEGFNQYWSYQLTWDPVDTNYTKEWEVEETVEMYLVHAKSKENMLNDRVVRMGCGECTQGWPNFGHSSFITCKFEKAAVAPDCTPTSAPTNAPETPRPFVILPSQNEFPAAKRDDMVDRINTLRGNLGLCPLSWDETIVQDVKDNYLLNETYNKCDEYQLEVEAGTNEGFNQFWSYQLTWDPVDTNYTKEWEVEETVEMYLVHAKSKENMLNDRVVRMGCGECTQGWPNFGHSSFITCKFEKAAVAPDCTPTSAPTNAPETPRPFVILPSQNEFPAAKRDDMVDRINTLRGNLGLCPLSWDETIVQDVKDNYLLNETYNKCDEYQLEVEAGTNEGFNQFWSYQLTWDPVDTNYTKEWEVEETVEMYLVHAKSKENMLNDRVVRMGCGECTQGWPNFGHSSFITCKFEKAAVAPDCTPTAVPPTAAPETAAPAADPAAACPASGYTVTADGLTLTSESLGGAASAGVAGQRVALSSIPEPMAAGSVFQPAGLPVAAGTTLVFDCCGAMACDFYVSHYRCRGCAASEDNGGLPAALLTAAEPWAGGSCAPHFADAAAAPGSPTHPMVTFHKRIPAGTQHSVSLSRDLSALAVFASRASLLADAWCPVVVPIGPQFAPTSCSDECFAL